MNSKKSLVILLSFFFLSYHAFSHPLDISITTVKIERNMLNMETFIHGYQVSLLARDNNLNPAFLTIKDLRTLLNYYFNRHFKVIGQKGVLRKSSFVYENAEIHQILSSGIKMNYYIAITPEDYPITFESDLFIEYSATQTNKIIFLDENGNLLSGSEEVLLTPKMTKWELNISRPDYSLFQNMEKDSDTDGLSDNFELLYGLDPQNADTDYDGFSDYEEFEYGWDPFDANPAHDQSRKTIADQNKDIAEENISDQKLLVTSIFEKKITKENDETPGQARIDKLRKEMLDFRIGESTSLKNRFFIETVTAIEETFSAQSGFVRYLIFFLSIIALGFLHTLSAGPGKGMLIASLASKEKDYKKALLFIVSFLLSHSIISVSLSILFYKENPGMNAPLVSYLFQAAGGITIIILSVFALKRSIQKIKGKIFYKKMFFDSTRGIIILACLTGMGSSPFLLIIFKKLAETGKSMLIPLIFIFFAFGSALLLFLTALAVFLVRHIVHDIFPKTVQLSEIISASFSLFFALFFLFPVMPI